MPPLFIYSLDGESFFPDVGSYYKAALNINVQILVCRCVLVSLDFFLVAEDHCHALSNV